MSGYGISQREADFMVTTPEQVFNSMCVCRGCPTYRMLGKQDDYVAYCFPTHGRSRNITDEKGCICGVCPVYSMNKFLTQYYCTRGSEAQQKDAIAKEAQTGKSVWELLPPRP